MKEILRVNKLNADLYKYCTAHYEQSLTYHTNFLSLEKEF
jgi:hypothetical protein